jgi:hypothetical protein
MRAFLIAGATLATAWWLLPEFGGEDPEPGVSGNAARPLDTRIEDARNAAVVEPAPRRDAVAAVRRAPAGVGEPRVDSAPGEPHEPIPLIEGITLPGGMWNLHTMMERESRDAVWADEMERQFAMYFASKPELARSFGQPSVLCRSHFCEIQAVGYGPGAFATWKTATEDLRDQPWGIGLNAGGIYTIERAPNEQAVVLILMRPWIVVRDGAVDVRATPPEPR